MMTDQPTNVFDFARRMTQPPTIETFENLWRDTCEEVADQYPPGCGEFIKEHHPDLRAALDEAWDAALEFWGEDIDQFREEIKHWKELHMRSIALFEAIQQEGEAEPTQATWIDPRPRKLARNP